MVIARRPSDCSRSQRWLSRASLVLACAGCVSSSLEAGPDHPASAQAASAPLAQVGSALEPSFELEASSSDGATESPTRWTCPMHPEIIRKEPGNCPICGMKLQPVPPKDPPKASP